MRRPDREPSSPIAFFLPTLDGGGAERAVIDATRTLVSLGHAVDLVVANAGGTYRDDVPSAVRVVDLGGVRTAQSLRPLVRYLQREQPKALFAALTHANLVAIGAAKLARWRGRLLVSERSTLSAAWSHYPAWRRALQCGVLRRAYGGAHTIVGVSQGVADDLASTLGISNARLAVLYNATATPELQVRASESPTHPWFTDGLGPVFVAVGRLTSSKDFPTLLQAMQRVRTAAHLAGHVAPRLIILGEGEDRHSLEGLRVALDVGDVVSMPGFVKNPFACMAHAHALVLSSRFEGLPNALIQALAVGCPVIATDCPSGPREILAEGRYGALVPVGDADALAAAITEAAARPRATVDSRAVAPFTPDAVAAQLCALLALPAPSN